MEKLTIILLMYGLGFILIFLVYMERGNKYFMTLLFLLMFESVLNLVVVNLNSYISTSEHWVHIPSIWVNIHKIARGIRALTHYLIESV